MSHNVTPSRYFVDHDPAFAAGLEWGRHELELLRERTALAVADSRFNAEELAALGFADVKVNRPGCAPTASSQSRRTRRRLFACARRSPNRSCWASPSSCHTNARRYSSRRCTYCNGCTTSISDSFWSDRRGSLRTNGGCASWCAVSVCATFGSPVVSPTRPSQRCTGALECLRARACTRASGFLRWKQWRLGYPQSCETPVRLLTPSGMGHWSFHSIPVR